MPFAKGQSGNPAGRKPTREKFDRAVIRAEKRVADKLPELIDNLFKLADGGFELGSDQLEPAGLITVGAGENQTLAFPDMDPNALVVTKQTRSIATPDRAANIYLVDRILGKPTERQELSGPDGGPIALDEPEQDRRLAALIELARTRATRNDPLQSE